jgi:hypothetical protein
MALSLLKRGLKGPYVAVEPYHLDRHVGEQVFRFNNRGTRDNPLNDADRFVIAMSQLAGKGITYAPVDREGWGRVPLVRGRDGGRGTVLALVAAGSFAGYRLAGWPLRIRHTGSLKHRSRQLLEILPGLRSFVVFVFHLSSLSSGKAG